MNSEYLDVLDKYVAQIQDYTDNLLGQKECTQDEHFKIHEPLLKLSQTIDSLRPKEFTPEPMD